MSYELQPMLRIRGLREDRAQGALVVARHARDVAERELEVRREKRRAYDETKEARRDRIFDAVVGRAVSRQDLDLAREAVSEIDEESMLLHRDEDRAADEHRAREAEAEAAHVVYVSAAKERMKISEHRKIWEEEDRLQREALSDAEMEEFAERRMTADDDDTFD